MSDSLDELAAVHTRYGAAGVDLAKAPAPDLPEGWTIITRRWAFRCWDALIRPPADGPVGWRLADPFASTRRKAIKRAIAEIRDHLLVAEAARQRREAAKAEEAGAA